MNNPKASAVDPIYQQLKEVVWFRAFSSKNIIDEDHYYRGIAEEITQLKNFPTFSRPGFHWQTVRNFYQNRVKPTTKTLEILATYAMESSSLVSWRNFIDMMERGEDVTTRPTVESLGNGSWRIRIVVEVPLILEVTEIS